ncbi:hypothetical protein SAMN04488515_0693 [Cognatiyoonia koreensis]|uniref:Uncharacterized protein n=1 Tax=Cognatiyoonia koreensis TaxID=364200 RepID=A0A1I0NLV9_9RHOB|nr:hypothetical protein [Cognatiyoonia koreensis]SEW02228.1 hypothetical protein SAMN04488515_0693 [Cognatiyoonia koreensis]
MWRFASYLIGVAFCLTASAASALVLPPPPADCTLRDGTEIRFQGADSNEISLVETSRNGSSVVLGFPEQRRGLTIRARENGSLFGVVGQLQTMIASPDTFNLLDVAAAFDQDKFNTEIGYLSPDLLRCMAKDN